MIRKKTRSSGVLESSEWGNETFDPIQESCAAERAEVMSGTSLFNGNWIMPRSLPNWEFLAFPLRRLENPRTPCFFPEIKKKENLGLITQKGSDAARKALRVEAKVATEEILRADGVGEQVGDAEALEPRSRV